MHTCDMYVHGTCVCVHTVKKREVVYGLHVCSLLFALLVGAMHQWLL